MTWADTFTQTFLMASLSFTALGKTRKNVSIVFFEFQKGSLAPNC